MRQTNTRWTVLRRFAISFLLVLVCDLRGEERGRITAARCAWRLRAIRGKGGWHGTAAGLDGLTALDANGFVSPALAVDWQSDATIIAGSFVCGRACIFTMARR